MTEMGLEFRVFFFVKSDYITAKVILQRIHKVSVEFHGFKSLNCGKRDGDVRG